VTKPNTLQELFDLAAENVKGIFEQSGEVLPMWHVVLGNNEHTLISTPWSNEEEKTATVFALRRLFRQQRVRRFVLMVEAWVAEVRTEREVYEGPRPSEHPDRREVLMISAEDRDGSHIGGVYYILRPEHGPPKLSPLEVKPYEKTTGRMVGLLD
jgi:hypothetical protein